MNNKLFALLLITAAIFIGLSGVNVSAEAIDWSAVYNSDNDQYKNGGVNSFCDETCSTQEDTDNLNDFLQHNSDYILVNTHNKDISDEDWQLICDNKSVFPFKYYLNSDYEFGYTYYKVYVYKPLYDIIINHLKNGDKIDDITQTYFSYTAVVVNDAEWFYRERAGRVVQEFNDNFPIRYQHFGFIQFESPIDCEIKIRNTHDNIYNVIYVPHDKPFLVKLPYAAYEITDINAVNMPRNEETLGTYGNNTFYLSEDFTEENPKIISIERAVEKYDIQPMDISDKPDFSWENRENITDEDLAEDRTVDNDDYVPQDQPIVTSVQAEHDVSEGSEMPVESVIVQEKDDKAEQQSTIKMILLILVAIAVGVIIFAVRTIKKNNNKNNY